MKLILQTDGGARGNPGPAGVGAVIMDEGGKVLETAAKFLGEKLTNNEAEYQALIFGLESLKKFAKKAKIKSLDLTIRLDSELVVKQLRGEYKIKEARLKSLSEQVKKKINDFNQVIFTHLPREANKLADELANQAMDDAA